MFTTKAGRPFYLSYKTLVTCFHLVTTGPKRVNWLNITWGTILLRGTLQHISYLLISTKNCWLVLKNVGRLATRVIANKINKFYWLKKLSSLILVNTHWFTVLISTDNTVPLTRQLVFPVHYITSAADQIPSAAS